MIEKFREAFREEASELLNNLENTLLELESDPSNMETISAVFRTMHTIKGSSSMFGFDEVSKFTHGVESVMDMLREKAFVADRTLIDLTLKARDLISSMLASPSPENKALSESLGKQFKDFAARKMAEKEAERDAVSELPALDASAAAPGPTSEEPSVTTGAFGVEQPGTEGTGAASFGESPSQLSTTAPQHVPGVMESFRIHFVPEPNVFQNGTKPLLLLDELRSLGSYSVVPLTDKLPPISQLQPEQCYIGWDILLTTDRGEDAIKDVFIFVDGSCELSIERISAPAKDSEEGTKKLGEILVERGVTSQEHIETVLNGQKKLGEMLVEENVATAEQVKSALDEQEHLKRMKEKTQQELGTASIRVSSDKLDALVDLVGELVTLQARLYQTSVDLKDGSLSMISEQFERLVSQLRDNTMSIRMLPIGSTFSRFKRVVRDLSAELGKEIDLVTYGAETELDKTVIEKLNDPLVHIIRNSVDHGIELPSDREAKGKARTGTVTLSAMHSGAHVLIEVMDDGGGLDTDRILTKAVEKGIVPQGANLSEQELFMLIFAPGFSTAKVVTNVSGRGVGMDVVKREIDSLGGSVSVDSTRGKGMKVTLKIPLTLAIIEGLLIRIADEHYIIPLSSVDGCIELDRSDLRKDAAGRKILTYRNEILPFVGIRELYDITGEPPTIEQIVVVNAQDARVGFVVDQVIGDHQTVIKPLGRMFKSSEGVSGATILGDGTVALILDVNRLSAQAVREEMQQLDRSRG